MTLTIYNEHMAVNDSGLLAETDEVQDEMVTEIVPFGRALKFYRSRAGLTQPELAEIVNTTPTTLSNWEGRADPPSNEFILSEIGLCTKAPT